MRTIIRLRRCGVKNTPQYKLIVQGHYKRLKGRYIEHLGYWFPVKVNEHNRSIILNKSRLRYWIGVGAVFSPKVQKMLSFADLAPAPWVSFGTQTLYKNSAEQKERLSEGVKKFINSQRESGFKGRMLERMRQRDEENLLIRRVKFGRAIGQYVNEKEEIVEDDAIAEDDINARTENFLRLKKIYDNIEKNDPLMSPLKREMLYREMNELANSGILPHKLEEKPTATTSNDIIENLYEARSKRALKTLVGAANMFQPITKEEFISVARMHVILNDFDDYLDDFLESRQDKNAPLTKADLHIFCKIYDIQHNSDQLTPQEIKDIEKGFMTPSRYPLTPFPNADDYDPKDWFETNDEQSFNITHNYKGEDKWFDLPLTEARKEAFKEARDKQFRSLFELNPRLKHK